MTLFRGTFVDCPDDPFSGGSLRVDGDGGLLVRHGRIEARGGFETLRSHHPHEPVTDLRGGLVLPGFVDTHVHFPQIWIMGGLGMPLLDWLTQRALPEEARLADPTHATVVAHDFVGSLVRAGTTSALVFGSHFPGAVDLLFEEATRAGIRVTCGLVVSDRVLREDLLTTPARAVKQSLALAARWHGTGRMRYAVTPRFSLSCTDAMLASCAEVLESTPGAFLTSHVNEDLAEIASVRKTFGCSYVGSYDRHDLVGRHTVLAHNVHPSADELTTLADRGAAIAHCPSSNCALGSGLFPFRAHHERAIRVGLGTDVGAGTDFSLLREGLHAYFVQRLLGRRGVGLAAAHLLHLATTAGADVLDLPEVGDFTVGKQFDAVWLRPPTDSTLDTVLKHATDADDAMAKVFALGSSADVAEVWVGGARIHARSGA